VLVSRSVNCRPDAVTRPTAASSSGLLVIASRPRSGCAHATTRLHQLHTSATFLAAIWQRFRSRVTNPPQPHWFFNSSYAFSMSALCR
jgi:hypothetical protein